MPERRKERTAFLKACRSLKKRLDHNPMIYRHIRNYYLSNSKTFEDGNGNGNFLKN